MFFEWRVCGVRWLFIDAKSITILFSRVRALWINVNNCPKRCDYIQFYYISAENSTCFGWYPHPSSGAHSDSNCNIWHWSNRIFYPTGVGTPTPPRQRTVANKVRTVPDVVIRVWMFSWWWMRVQSETRRAVCRSIIKLHIVASHWTIIDLYNNLFSPMRSDRRLSFSNSGF